MNEKNTFNERRPLPAKGQTSDVIADLREQLPDGTILLLRRLQFYECFGADAGYASRAIMQPARLVRFTDQALPMFSIPVKKAAMFARRIANATGLVVAMCDSYPHGTIDGIRTRFVHPDR